MLHTVWTFNLCTDKNNAHTAIPCPFFVSKQINTLQIDTLYLQLEANLVKLTKGPFFFAWLCLSLQVDVKSSITYCTRNKFTALIASSGHSVCKHSGAAVQRFALVCCSSPVYEGHVRLDSSRRGEEPPVLSSSSLTINLLYGSVRAARSTLTPCPFILQHTHAHTYTHRHPSNPTHWPSLRRWYAVDSVVLDVPGRVQRAALQQPIDNISARLLVLVSEQGVHERVAGGLAVS